MDPATVIQLISLGVSVLSVLAAGAAHYRLNQSPKPGGSTPVPAPVPSPAPTPTDPIHPDHPVLKGLLQALILLQQALAQQGTVPPLAPAKT